MGDGPGTDDCGGGGIIQSPAGRTRPVPGASSRLVGGWRFPPMDCTPAIATLAALAEECAHELGFEVTAASTGGISYANPLASLGVPVLDGLGPVGGPDEYIVPSSIVPRTALLAMLGLRSAGASTPVSD